MGAAPDLFEVVLFGSELVAELVTEDAKGARRVAEGAGDLVGGAAFDEVRAQGFVLAMEGFLGLEEEAGRGDRYLIRATDRHNQSMLLLPPLRNPLWGFTAEPSRCRRCSTERVVFPQTLGARPARRVCRGSV